MTARNGLVWLLVGAGLAGGCDRSGAPPPPPPGAGAPAAAEQAQQAGEAAEEAQQRDPGIELVREVFAYRGSGRDPFLSLLRSGEVRPLLEDLRVTTIHFNERYPSASVAVLRDTTVNQRYTVRVGDELGRMRIAEIRAQAVMLIIEEFGVEREHILRLRRRQEGT
ncbi:MAG: hypothetical protein GTN62_08140 [Gemmatimonadales bacterium]|nr:hypothetical protein [Gemmatimonadales bacterium]NIN11462.1 hypothetical protein [Gemmatimonadales bacterium]NIN50071.1 hypothetical protein [Gemmatimonadales bacterium]NIP07535.1 hypothetical protein [Gemmatimonadales bacterium]NIR03177.1 hypothetical protein [Gemmatimonadales bacterium]